MADASTGQKVKWQKQMAKSLNDIYDHCFGLAQDPALKKDPTIAKDPSCNQAAFRQHASDITAQMTWLNSEISTTSTAFVKAASDELKVHVAKVNDRVPDPYEHCLHSGDSK